MRTIDVRQGYDLWASTYDQLDNPMVAMTIVAMRRWSPSGRRVLELGCGTGRNARFFLERGVEAYVGVDVSAGMLEQARRSVPDARARFLQQDGSEALALEPFDGVLLSLVLEHSEDVAPLLRSAARAARPGAWLRIYELHPRLREQGSRAHFRSGDDELYLPSHPHDVAEIQRAMAGSWQLRSTTDWYADPLASPRTERYRGRPMLLEIDAVRV